MISLLFGLGNIGRQYRATWHNLGLEVVESVCKDFRAARQSSRSTYEWAVANRNDRKIILAWPKTYMNRSGIAARELLEDFGMQPQQMLIVTDDFNLPLGRLRFRSGGSDGGHNGLASVIEVLETQELPRLRLGIGPVPENVDVADWVLSPFEPQEVETVKKMVAAAVEAAIFALDHRLEEAMTRYNVNPA